MSLRRIPIQKSKKQFFSIILTIIIFTQSFSIPETSSLTGVCIAIEEFIEKTSYAGKKIEYLEASSIMEFENGLFAQRVKFRDSSSETSKIFNFIFLVEGGRIYDKVLTLGNPDEFINSVIGNSLRVRTLYKPDGTIIVD